MNLYPFVETVALGRHADECVEQIDIGGPSMVRAAAKNHPERRDRRLPDAVRRRPRRRRAGGFTLEQRRALAAAAFAHTATYDVAVASWFGSVVAADRRAAPASRLDRRDVGARRGPALRRELAPARGALRHDHTPSPGLAQATQLQGKEMSYNNYVDADAARRAAYDMREPAVAIIKHANPCGIAVGADIADAHRKAHDVRPGLRVRRRDRGEPHGHARRWPSRSPTSSPR